MTQLHDDIVGLDAAILMHPRVWEASGHVENFTDPLVDCKKCKQRFRADQIDQAKLARKECPECGGELTDTRKFNLMFKTNIGPVDDGSGLIYLRPETAQGIYVNYKNIVQSNRMKIPFGIAQIGKAFRNEIVTKNFIFRTCEFEQMEMQYFVKPGDDEKFFDYWREQRWAYYDKLGVRMDKLRWHQHGPESWPTTPRTPTISSTSSRWDSRSSKACTIAPTSTSPAIRNIPARISSTSTRTTATRASYPSSSKPRPGSRDSFSCCSATPTRSRKWPTRATTTTGGPSCTSIRPSLRSPSPCFPSMKKDGLAELAQDIRRELKEEFATDYDQSGAIGRRYRRQDEIGTPFCVTVDYQSKDDGTVTVRHRDSMEQIRVHREGAWRPPSSARSESTRGPDPGHIARAAPAHRPHTARSASRVE